MKVNKITALTKLKHHAISLTRKTYRGIQDEYCLSSRSLEQYSSKRYLLFYNLFAKPLVQ